jgi:hypothetical protein
MDGEGRIVRDQDECAPLIAMETEEQIDHALSVGRIQIAGGFIRKKKCGAADEGPRDRDPLLFAARELDGIVVLPVRQTDFFEETERLPVGVGIAPEFQGNLDVFKSGQCRDKMERLENHPELFPTQPSEFVLAEFG